MVKRLVGPDPRPTPLSVIQPVFGSVTPAALVVIDVAVLDMNSIKIAVN